MCTVELGEAMVSDIALPAVRAAVALNADSVVPEESVPGQGTRLRETGIDRRSSIPA